MNTKPTCKDIDMRNYAINMGLLFLLAVVVLLFSIAVIK